MHVSEYDIPAVFKYFTKLTKQRIDFIGHSQATTQMFALLSNPSGSNHDDVVKNLKIFAASGPVAYMVNVESKLLKAMANIPLLPLLIERVGKFGIFLPDWVESEAGCILCDYIERACDLGLRLFFEADLAIDNQDILDVLAGNFPAGIGVMDLFHWRQ